MQSYAKDAIKEIKKEISEKERKIIDCEGCFEYLEAKQDTENKLNRAKKALEETLEKIQNFNNQKASLREKLSLAEKLQLKDYKCPVCDSKVEKLNPLFQEKHLKEEILSLEENILSSEQDKKVFNKKIIEFSNKLNKISEATATLKAHSIKNKEELNRIQQEIKIKKTNLQKIPITITNNSLMQVATIDSHAKMMFESISKLEVETKGFDYQEFSKLRKSIEEKQHRLSDLDQKIGALTENIQHAAKEISSISLVLSELGIVKKYIETLDEIQEKVYNRDGLVATSLRSWALNAISSKTSEYLTLLNTKIQRISLIEKTRDVSIDCYSKNEVLDLESLSGGEQVSVALALRLGMASLLGASNLNLIILDEPTTHLDTEHRKALVGVLAQLSNIPTSGIPMQFIIITHDSEIFEDSNVERIYRFNSTDFGSKVIGV